MLYEATLDCSPYSQWVPTCQKLFAVLSPLPTRFHGDLSVSTSETVPASNNIYLKAADLGEHESHWALNLTNAASPLESGGTVMVPTIRLSSCRQLSSLLCVSSHWTMAPPSTSSFPL
jgi:hypothetical protein